jgi:probable F420-dependent oxidoreductase
MKIGVLFPQTEIGQDQGAIRAFAEAAEELGYDHLVVYDHVLGADPAHRQNWSGPYTHESLFHEPFVLFGYLAAVTRNIGLTTGIMILPQRQTALVAKQAAEVDRLSDGRLRLGVGVGWNDVEYEALSENFHNRGVRIEEQVAVLRALWTKEVVSFHGKWHRIVEAGINPMPVQRPIPLWFGGGRTETVVRRIARLGDGWFPQIRPDDAGRNALEQFRRFAQEAGRDPATIGIETGVRVSNGEDSLEQALRDVQTWKEMDVTHLSVRTMGAGFSTVDEHINAIRRFKQASSD